ncbi:hypothetical protein HNQ59_001730 [Chitinivorax tropicus]|uniref:DUF333 domain-containing protein n=1 Tax=Chitinivorax tropicus TaxID=714531 RepID=A0A840MTA1_9PROT|nr:hypothetical protein [Chitinivorax tropicus]MBB5018441.1 hypothetical protein [Chitinivorax tropicus]
MYTFSVRLGVMVMAAALAGCAAVAGKTNMLSDDDIKSKSAGVLGYQPNELTLLNKRVDGTDTYVNLKTKDGKEFTCLINGGNLLTLGMTNPPMCNRKGEPVKAEPFKKK